MRWQEQAPALGSKVWFVLGNHEVMNTFGMRTYNTAEEYLSFDHTSRAAGERAHAAAFAPSGWLYEWLVRQHFVARIGPYLFSHADFPVLLSDWTVEEIVDRALAAYRRPPVDSSMQRLPEALFAPDRSILWCREAQIERPYDYASKLKAFLARNNAAAWICGHTPAEDGTQHLLYGGRYLCIDTAMTFKRFGVGRTSALVIDAESAGAYYFDRGEVVREPLALAGAPPRE